MKADKEKEGNNKFKDMLKEITSCLEAIGFINPFNKVYNLTKDLDFFPLVAALFTINILS